MSLKLLDSRDVPDSGETQEAIKLFFWTRLGAPPCENTTTGCCHPTLTSREKRIWAAVIWSIWEDGGVWQSHLLVLGRLL